MKDINQKPSYSGHMDLRDMEDYSAKRRRSISQDELDELAVTYAGTSWETDKLSAIRAACICEIATQLFGTHWTIQEMRPLIPTLRLECDHRGPRPRATYQVIHKGQVYSASRYY